MCGVIYRTAASDNESLRRLMPMPCSLGNRIRNRSRFLDDDDIDLTVKIVHLLEDVEADTAAVAVFQNNDRLDVRSLESIIEVVK